MMLPSSLGVLFLVSEYYLSFTAQSIFMFPIFIKMSSCWLKLLRGGAATCYITQPNGLFVRALREKIPSLCLAVSCLEFLPLLMQEHDPKGLSECVLMILAASVNQFVHSGCGSAEKWRRLCTCVHMDTRVCRRYKTLQGKHTVL